MRKYFDRRFALVGSFVAVVLAFAGIASGTIVPGKPTTYSACVAPSGIMRLINSGSSCKRGERLITWNQSGTPGSSGATGPAGAAGEAGASADGGATGSTGPAGATGLTGPTGIAGVAGATGATGAAGTAGIAGTAGANGTNGTAGSDAVSGYTYIYNVGAQVVAIAGSVTFDTNGPNTVGFTHTAGTSAISVVNAGVYSVSFSVTGTETNQMAVFLNGAAVPGSTYGSGAINQQNNGHVIFSVPAGGVITIRNNTSAAATTLQTLAGGSAVIANASITVEQLS